MGCGTPGSTCKGLRDKAFSAFSPKAKRHDLHRVFFCSGQYVSHCHSFFDPLHHVPDLSPAPEVQIVADPLTPRGRVDNQRSGSVSRPTFLIKEFAALLRFDLRYFEYFYDSFRFSCFRLSVLLGGAQLMFGVILCLCCSFPDPFSVTDAPVAKSRPGRNIFKYKGFNPTPIPKTKAVPETSRQKRFKRDPPVDVLVVFGVFGVLFSLPFFKDCLPFCAFIKPLDFRQKDSGQCFHFKSWNPGPVIMVFLARHSPVLSPNIKLMLSFLS